MSGSERRSFGSLLKQFTPIIALLILLAPSVVIADPFLMLHNEGNVPIHEAERPSIRKALSIGLNENGDLVIRHSDVSLIMAYNPPNDIVTPQERIRNAQRQDNPAINGISLKISLLF